MKKFRITIKEKCGQTHKATVLLEEETAKLLLETGDKRLLHDYLLEEYKFSRRDRTETRRHRSLEFDQENGIEYASEEESLNLTDFLDNMDDTRLQAAVSNLKPQQKEIIRLYFQENMTEEEIAAAVSLSKSGVSKAISRILARLKKIY
jgi:RNA polymerase sigma factor (sigma-70 family)